MSRARTALARLSAPILALLVACQPGDRNASEGVFARSDVRAEDSLAGQGAAKASLGIAPSSEWRRMSPPNAFLVSPRWSASGEWLLMSGRMGTGLFARNLASDRYDVIDEGYRGPAEWLRERDVICLKDRSSDEARTFDMTRRRLDGDAQNACADRPWDESLGSLIDSEPSGKWYHHPKEGRVSLERPDGRVDTMVAAEAWGVRVAPGGARVAYSTGVLADPTLYVLDLDAGETRVLGRGAYPVWMPDGERLIFTSPGELAPFTVETATFDSADLFLYDAASDTLHALTDTPEVAEMEPALSPNGSEIAFSDWRDGTVYVAALSDGGGK